MTAEIAVGSKTASKTSDYDASKAPQAGFRVHCDGEAIRYKTEGDAGIADSLLVGRL